MTELTPIEKEGRIFLHTYDIIAVKEVIVKDETNDHTEVYLKSGNVLKVLETPEEIFGTEDLHQ